MKTLNYTLSCLDLGSGELSKISKSKPVAWMHVLLKKFYCWFYLEEDPLLVCSRQRMLENSLEAESFLSSFQLLFFPPQISQIGIDFISPNTKTICNVPKERSKRFRCWKVRIKVLGIMSYILVHKAHTICLGADIENPDTPKEHVNLLAQSPSHNLQSLPIPEPSPPPERMLVSTIPSVIMTTLLRK